MTGSRIARRPVVTTARFAGLSGNVRTAGWAAHGAAAELLGADGRLGIWGWSRMIVLRWCGPRLMNTFVESLCAGSGGLSGVGRWRS